MLLHCCEIFSRPRVVEKYCDLSNTSMGLFSLVVVMVVMLSYVVVFSHASLPALLGVGTQISAVCLSYACKYIQILFCDY